MIQYVEQARGSSDKYIKIPITIKSTTVGEELIYALNVPVSALRSRSAVYLACLVLRSKTTLLLAAYFVILMPTKSAKCSGFS